MQLDPELKPLEAMTLPDFGDVAGARRWLAALAAATPPLDAHFSAGLTIADQTIPGPGGDLPVRLYRPADTPAAALVYFHGGSTIMGGLDTDHLACLTYAHRAEAVVISVDYRLAPEHRFPAGVEDCYAALCWTRDNAAKLGIGHLGIAIGGSSAGGTLAAGVALMARDRRGPQPALQMLIYPALDDRMDSPSMNALSDPRFLTKTVVGHMWRHYLGAPGVAASPYAAPARATDFSDLAPAYVEAGALDPLRDEAIDYAARLLRAGIPAELHVLTGAPHAYDILPETAIARRVFALRSDALRRACAGH